MGLFAPWFLGGLAAIGLPVFLHLLQRHKTDPVPFASLMFFERRTQSSVKHRRLRYLVLLAARVAILALLALAFANPFISSKPTATAGSRRMVAVVDESFSMRAGTRMDEAKRGAVSYLAGRRGSQKAQVWALGAQIRQLTEAVTDDAALRAATDAIQAGDERATFAELARAIRASAQSTPESLDVHFFTDAQMSGMPSDFADLALPANTALTVHAVGKTEPNWAVEWVTAPSEVWDTKKARVIVTVSGYQAPAATKTVTLVVNGKPLGSKSAEVPANGRATVEFTGLDVGYGFSKCEARIEGGDVLAADDRALFAVSRSDPRRVLFLHEARDTRSPLYFRAGLEAAAGGAFQLDAMPVERAANADLSQHAFVVLSDLAGLPGNLEASIRRRVEAGAGLLIAIGPTASKRHTIPVVEEKIGEAVNYARTGERYGILGEADPGHASFRRTGRWEGVKFYYAAKVESETARVVARLNDQTPLVVEKKLGEGVALIFASTFDNVSNDFPLAPSFVPFLEQTSRYLAGVEERPGTMTVNSFVELRSNRERAASVEVLDPEGNRALSLSESAKAQTFGLTREGFFEIRRASGRSEMVAALADRKESDLGVAPAETVALWSGKQATEEPGKAAIDVAEEVKNPYGWYLLLLVLAAVAAETFLSGRYLGVQREEA